jgi:uncharacterized SAM-binding protein YcdF (DUF218 family)
VIIDFLKERFSLGSPLLFVVVLAIGVALLYTRPRLGRRFFLLALVGFWLVATSTGANLLTIGLARGLPQIQSKSDAQGADAVVLLGGGAVTFSAGGRMGAGLTPSSMLRALEAARVAGLIDARVVIASAGIPRPDVQRKPESEMLRVALVAAGVPADLIVEESISKSTREQAQLIPEVLRTPNVRRFVLVTSPAHMRRALALFRAEGLDPVPSVALLRSDDAPPLSLAMPGDAALRQSNEAFYEYAAWAYYLWKGWLKPRAILAQRSAEWSIGCPCAALD